MSRPRSPTGGRDDETAQSNVLGFVLVFTIVVTTIGVVFAAGVPVLQDVQDRERVDNMERAFEILDNNVEDIVYREAPSRATEIRLSGGSIDTAGSTRVNVSVENDPNSPYIARTRPITYADEGTTIRTAFGGVVRSDGAGATMISEPEWRVSGERAVLPLIVTTQSADGASVGGSLTLLVVADAERRTASSFETDPGNVSTVTVTVTSAYPSAWARYFDSKDVGSVSVSGDQVTYELDTEAVYVPRVRISVGFQR
ncbi:MAG: hypothetical protein ABEJ79_01180 [Halolamina sp.]